MDGGSGTDGGRFFDLILRAHFFSWQRSVAADARFDHHKGH